MHVLSALRDVLTGIAAPAASALAGAGVLALLAMMVVITFDVILRYFFNDPTVWAGEVASFLTIAVVFLGLAQNIRLGDHIRIDAFTNLLSARVRLFLDVFAHAVGIVFAVVLLMSCWARFDSFWTRQTVGDSPIMIPLWIPMLPVLVGAAVFLLAVVAGFVVRLHEFLSGHPARLRNAG